MRKLIPIGFSLYFTAAFIMGLVACFHPYDARFVAAAGYMWAVGFLAIPVAGMFGGFEN